MYLRQQHPSASGTQGIGLVDALLASLFICCMQQRNLQAVSILHLSHGVIALMCACCSSRGRVDHPYMYDADVSIVGALGRSNSLRLAMMSI